MAPSVVDSSEIVFNVPSDLKYSNEFEVAVQSLALVNFTVPTSSPSTLTEAFISVAFSGIVVAFTVAVAVPEYTPLYPFIAVSFAEYSIICPFSLNSKSLNVATHGAVSPLSSLVPSKVTF